MRQSTTWMAYALAAGLIASSAAAKPFPEGGATPAEVATVLQDYGVRAKVTTDSAGDPMIESAVSGVNYAVIFHGCEGKPARCGSLEFSAALDADAPIPAAVVSAWHNTKRFTSVTHLQPNEVTLTMDVFIEKGASTELLAGYLSVWESMLGDFLRHIGWDEPSPKPVPTAAPGKTQA